jgi:thioredoxin 1
MNLGRAAMVGWSAVVFVALLAAGCTKEPAERQVRPGNESARPETARATAGLERMPDSQPETAGRLPRLIDLGRGTCVPCKMMAPILEEIGREYRGRAIVEVIDLREDEDAGARYDIRLIPTQILFDAEGTEVWRHEGFLAKDAIIAKFSEMGVEPLDD